MRDTSVDLIEGADSSRSWDDEFSVKKLVAAVRHRWFVVLPVFAVVLALGTWRTLNEPRRYRAFTTVRVQQQRPSIPGMQTGWGGVDYRFDRMVSEQRIIGSRQVAERVAETEGLRLRIAKPSSLRRTELFGDRIPVVDSTAASGEYLVTFDDRGYRVSHGSTTVGSAAYGTPVQLAGVRFTIPVRPRIEDQRVVLEVVPTAAAAAEVQGGVASAVVEKTDIIEISYTGFDPVTVQRVANAIARSYQEFSKAKEREEQANKTLFIAQNLAEQRDSLRAAQEDLRSFREGNQLTDVSAEQLALQERIENFETQRRETQLEMNLYNSLLKQPEGRPAEDALRRLGGTQAVANNGSIKSLYDRWFDLEKDRGALIANGRTSENPDVRALDSLIARTKQDLTNASSVYVRGLEARLATLDQQLADLRGQTTRFPGLSATEKNLEGRVRSMQLVYDNLQQQLQLARIDQSVDAGSVQLIDAATLPQWPVSPNRKRDVMLAAMLGVLLGMLLAVLLDKLDNSIRSVDDLKDQLDLPVLGLIPAIKVETEQQGPEVPDHALARLVTHADPRSPVAESYRSVRTNLAFARAHQGLRTLVLTSPGPADGKSTSVANLAITFAQQGQRTLLIDADLRRAVLDKTFGVPRSPGLTEVIVGSVPLEDAVHETPVENLFVMGSGQFPPNPSELLGSPAMRDVLAAAKEQFDLVLFDSPPLLAVTDAAVLSTMVDGTMLVVRMGKTARQAAQRALGQLRAVHGRVLGVLLNDVSVKNGGYYGGYGYAYYAYYGENAESGTNGRGPRTVASRLKDLAGIGGREREGR